MNSNDHAKVLYAYIARLTPESLDDIHKKAKKADFASTQCGLTTQLKTQNELADSIQSAIAKMINHDTNNIQRIIENLM